MPDSEPTVPVGDDTQLLDQVRALAEDIAAGQAVRANSISHLDPIEMENVRDMRSDRSLREKYALWIMILLGIQIVVADVVFFLYAAKGVHWQIPPVTMSTWLSSVVVQVVGVVLVVTKGLFSKPK